MINLEDLDVLKDKIVYATSDDKYVVYEDKEDILNVVNYILLGFQNNYTYTNSGGYLVKSTSAGAEIARLNLDVEHGVFKENFTYMYFYSDRTIYKIKENMDIDWEITFDDYIRTVIMDNYGSIYILFKNSRTIRKYDNTGEYILYLNESDDPATYCRLYTGFISEGSGHLYVIGTMFYNNKCQSFIDHYDVRKGKKVDREILCKYNNVKLDEDYFTYKDLYIDGDYVYIYANNYVEKLNLKMRSIWRYGFGYNYTTNTSDYLNQIIFDDKKFHDRIYFCENFDTSNGYSFGKLSTNGNLLWKLTNPEGITKSEFNVCIYQEQMYVVCKRDVDLKASYVLALDNNRVLFETREGHLVRIVQDNYDEIYSPESYTGRVLVGDTLKDGVSKFLTTVLLYDYGEILASEDMYLLVRQKNPNLGNPENYDYFKMIGSESIDEANEISRIVTSNGSHLVTFNNSYIDTLYPYTPELTNQYIVTPEGDYIDTNDDKHLIRNRGLYTDFFTVLADVFNYHQDIITKKKCLTVLTKRKNFSIRKKKKSIYRYVVKRLLDIDIIVEHLQQNGVLQTLVPNYVDKLRHHTTHMIRDMQEARSPVYFNLGACKRYSYIYDGYEFPLRLSNTQIFMCKNIPFIKKKATKSIYIEQLDKLVADEVVTPFILFLNGKAIKWSDITVVNDWNFVYLIINNSKDESEKLEAVMFPCVVRYGEDNNILSSNNKNMYFTSDGLLTNVKEDIGIRIEVIDKEVNGSETTLSKKTDFVEVPVEYVNQLSAVNNIFIFEDGLFFGDSRFYLDDHGKNIYTYARETSPVCKTFYFNSANDSKNSIYLLPNQDQARKNIIDKIQNNSSVPTDNFTVPFDFRLSRDKSYLRNISEATRYILTYNMHLLVDYYREQSNIKSFTFTGERIKKLSAANGGYLVMPRQMDNGCFDYIIVFKNDELYEYYNEIEYLDKEFRIPIFTHVANRDNIEILHFKNVINDISHIVVSTTPDYIQEDLRYNNFLLFSNSPSGKGAYDNYSKLLKVQYPVEFSYKNNFREDNGRYVNTSIALEDSYFAGKNLNICSKRQFHKMYYNIITEGVKEFPLTNEFMCCQNSNQYMIFVNNKKLNFSDWSYVIENNGKIDVPKIKTVAGLSVGDKITIFYIPDAYDEIILNKHLNSFGDIIIDASQLDYNLDSDLFMIFVDGKKIAASDIQNISMNRVRIKTEYPEYSNVCVCKYLNPDSLLEKVFSYGDAWSNAVESISSDQYNNLFIKAGVVK